MITCFWPDRVERQQALEFLSSNTFLTTIGERQLPGEAIRMPVQLVRQADLEQQLKSSH